MKRAALVVATSVALLLSGVSVSAHAATRKYVSMPSDGQVIGSGNGSSRSGDTLHVPGDGKTEYIPSSYGGGSKGTKLPVKVRYDYSIPRTIKGMVGTLKGGNIPAMGLTIGLQYMLDAVDGFIEDNQVKVPTVYPVAGGFSWKVSYFSDFVRETPELACKAAFSSRPGATFVEIKKLNTTSFYCVGRDTGGNLGNYATAVRQGTGCPAGAVYNDSNGSCEVTGSAPAQESDFDLMEAAAAAKESEWLKERLREHCEGGLNPQACYESLRDSVKLEGPSTVTEQGPTSTTTSPSGTTTTTSNTKIDITYGDNYYDYRTTKTTIVTKPDGTTETTTETEPDTDEPKEDQPEDMPALGDPYSPYINKLNEIKADVAAPPSVVPSIGYSSWYSFGGGCSELSFELPIYGSFTTNYCPYIYDWVRPILAFLFAVFTWHYCRSLWSEAVTQARPM